MTFACGSGEPLPLSFPVEVIDVLLGENFQN
jgi:hypothetical protein